MGALFATPCAHLILPKPGFMSNGSIETVNRPLS